jgi:O-antigen/teichoic acid export membrane protein
MRLPAPSQLAPLGTGQGRLSALRLPLLISLANQALSSGGNFLLGIYLARTMTLEHFGLYGIFYGLCML